jgi:mandelate racemase
MSAQLLALSPAAQYLEYFGVADGGLATPSVPLKGFPTPSDEPGGGADWNEDAVARFAFE